MGWKGIIAEAPLALVARLWGDFGAEVPNPKSILVIRSSDLGDLLTTTPVFQCLKNRFPAARITAVVGSWAADVVNYNPYVDEVVQLNAPWYNKFVPDQSWPARLRFFRSPEVKRLLNAGGYDVGIEITGSRSGHLLLMWLGARYRIGVRGYRGGWSTCQKYLEFSENVSVARAALAQAELLGATKLPEVRPQLFLSDDERARAEEIWGPPQRGRPRLLVGCGGGLPEKVWPARELGETLLRVTQDPNTSPNVLITGGSADRTRSAEVVARAGSNVRSVCGDTSLRITFALAEQADVVLTNASMLLHVAAAFRRPTVVVLGGMYSDAEKHDLLWGYPPPYVSVSPLGRDHAWPTVEQVTETLHRSLFGQQQ